MNINEKQKNVHLLIDELIQNLLIHELLQKNGTVERTFVIRMLLKISQLIPETVIDGDELVKYFGKKSH